MLYEVRSEAKMVSHNGVAMTDVSEHDHDRSIVVVVDSGKDCCRGGAAPAKC